MSRIPPGGGPSSEADAPELIYAALRQYKELGVIDYVLPSDPLGERWIIGQAGQILPLIGDDQAAAWLAGANSVAVHFLAKRAESAR